MWYQIQFLSFFLKKPHTSDLNPKNWFWDTFSPIYVVLLGRLFPKTIRFTHEWIRTNHLNFMKIGSTCIVRSYTYIRISTLQIRNQDLQNKKRDNSFQYTYMMERQLVYLSLQRGGTIVDTAEQQFLYVEVGLFQKKKKKKKRLGISF